MKLVSPSVSNASPARRANAGAPPTRPPVSDGLEFPKDGVDLARNERPVVLLHGTLVEKEGISAYRDFALDHGHPVDYRTYPSITKGRPIEESANIASRQVNLSRMEIAARNVDRLHGADDAALTSFFQLDADLYGAHDADVPAIEATLPGLVSDVRTLLDSPKGKLEDTFSGNLKRLETALDEKLQLSGVDAKKSKKVAAELLDSVAPKAIVVGHSAGGYVGYAMTVNPETTPDKDRFTYDGGNGIGEMLVLSAPIGEGLPTPAPPGVLDLGFYTVDSNVLRPIENHPASQLMLANPLFNIGYQMLKSMTKQAYHVANHVALEMANPLVHLARPGNAQVEQGSEFLEKYLKNRPVPDGVSVIAVTSPLDMLVQESRAKVDASQPNAHNFSADLGVTDAQIAKERPTWAHVIMTEQPEAFKEQFSKHLTSEPAELGRLLDPANDDGVRHEALTMLSAQLEADPSLLKGDLKKALKAVAAERAPFRDSPSYLAHQLLKA